MRSKWTAAILAVLLFCVAALPRTGEAADWKLSPYRTQLADNSSQSQTEEEVVAAPAIPGKKSIGKGVMFSLVIPGAGQLYGGQWWRALPWFAVEVAGWAMFANYHGQGEDQTNEFEAFAGPRDNPNHFDVNAYLLREWKIASSDQYNTAPYINGLAQWKTEPWSVRQTYLEHADGYGHDVLTLDLQQFFEMIGKYINQFGYGWEDTYPDGTNVNDEGAGHIWFWNPDTQMGDDPATVGFDGDSPAESPMFYQYRDMRGEANDLLDKGNIAMEVVLVNHILSALDAAFTVRSHNKHLEKTDMGDLKFKYDIKSVDGVATRFMTMSIALN